MDVDDLNIDLKNIPFDILFLIRVKAKEFKNQGVLTIETSDIKDYLYNIKWKNEEYLELCEAIDDIMSLEFSEIFDYMKVKVIKEASSMRLEDFSDLISK